MTTKLPPYRQRANRRWRERQAEIGCISVTVSIPEEYRDALLEWAQIARDAARAAMEEEEAEAPE